MAFVSETDSQSRPAVAQTTQRKSKLVPILLITLNVGVVALILIVALGGFKMPQIGLGGSTQPAIGDISSIPAEWLVTKEGRKLEPVIFGNFAFEITRIAYQNDVRGRSVTITVPGNPPQFGIFRVGERFGNGRVRIVDIQPSGVVLEADSKQESFGLVGGFGNDDWTASSLQSGAKMIPPSVTNMIPDIPPGQMRPATDPNAPQADVAVDKGAEPVQGEDQPQIETLEDLPLQTVVSIEPTEFNDLLRHLQEVFERQYVFGLALERESRKSFGLEIKKLAPDNLIATHALKAGDIILALNGEAVTCIKDLDTTALSALNVAELSIEILRDDEQQTFIFRPGAREKPVAAPSEMPETKPKPKNRK